MRPFHPLWRCVRRLLPIYKVSFHAALVVYAPGAAAAPTPAPGDAPGLLCRAAIEANEASRHIPEAFLAAIGTVESGRPLAQGGMAPWPWSVDAAGQGHIYATKAEAVAAVRQFQAQGVTSLDVGCLQVSLLYHPHAFASLEQAFDPAANTAFAAGLLVALRAQTGSWPRAAAAYHSATPALGQPYAQKVLATWAEPDRRLPFRARGAAPSDDAVAEPLKGATAVAGVAPGRAVAAGPTTGFNRMPLPRGAIGAGRTLAGYRAFPVRMALQPPLVSH